MPVKEDTDLLYEIAEKFCGKKVKDITKARGGANSRIFRIYCDDHCFALKFYRPRQQSLNDRLNTEASALKFFERCGVKSVPRLISVDLENNCSLLEWIEGEPVNDVSEQEMESGTNFFTQLHALKDRPEAASFSLGTEACLCGQELVRQLHKREEKLRVASKDNPILEEFLDQDFCPAVKQISAWAKTFYEKLGLNFSKEIQRPYLTLSPVDFGFHNALRRKKGDIVFLDFEYFGWVDSVNVIAETLLHPGMSLSEEIKKFFYKKMSGLYEPGYFFKERLKILFPLYGLRWCAIMMNQFLPGYVASNTEHMNEEEKRKLKQEKLRQAKSLTNDIRHHYKDFPYEG